MNREQSSAKYSRLGINNSQSIAADKATTPNQLSMEPNHCGVPHPFMNDYPCRGQSSLQGTVNNTIPRCRGNHKWIMENGESQGNPHY